MEIPGWRGTPRRFAIALVLITCAVPAWAQPRRRGHVVRIERPRANAAIQVCNVYGGQGMCFGTAPRPGAKAYVFDGDSYLGAIRVERATPRPNMPCNLDTIIDFSFVELSPLPEEKSMGATVFFGVEVLPDRARMHHNPENLPEPQQLGSGAPSVALDGDGDGRMDLVVTLERCDDAGPMPAATAGQTVAAFCQDYFTASSTGWHRAGQDRVFTCM